MMVPILKQGDVLIATIMAALSDEDMRQFREALLDRVVTSRATAVIIDVMAMDVLDSFATRTLREIAYMTRLRGAKTVLVGCNRKWHSRWCSSAFTLKVLQRHWIWRRDSLTSTG
jgi:rsbT antagonist protein RsbS